MATATERPVTVEDIKVLQVGKFGVRVDEKLWFGVNEPLTPSSFEVGAGYKVSVVTSKTGRKYINDVLGKEVQSASPSPETKAAQPSAENDPVKAAEAALAQAKATAEAKAKAAKAATSKSATKTTDRPARAGFGQPLTDYDIAKDRQIGRAGIIQAAVQAGAALQFATGLDEYLSNVRKIADFALKYSQE